MDTPFANLKESQDGQFIYIWEILSRLGNIYKIESQSNMIQRHSFVAFKELGIDPFVS